MVLLALDGAEDNDRAEEEARTFTFTSKSMRATPLQTREFEFGGGQRFGSKGPKAWKTPPYIRMVEDVVDGVGGIGRCGAGGERGDGSGCDR